MAPKHPPAPKPEAKAAPYYCAQHGCTFEAEAAPELCPVCGHPFHAHPDPAALTDAPQ